VLPHDLKFSVYSSWVRRYSVELPTGTVLGHSEAPFPNTLRGLSNQLGLTFWKLSTNIEFARSLWGQPRRHKKPPIAMGGLTFALLGCNL
jgi:hypothetical protein